VVHGDRGQQKSRRIAAIDLLQIRDLPSWFGDHIAAARERSADDALEWDQYQQNFLSPMYRFSIIWLLSTLHSVPREPNFNLL
jgi:hypothetical protein